MPSPQFILFALLVSAFSLSTVLARWHGNWTGNRADKGSVLAVLMGDSRRLFANHFFAKADIYFHSGYYPSIFDGPKQEERSHMEEDVAQHPDEEAEDEHHEHDETCDHGEEHEGEGEAAILDQPRDIIESFGRNFFITAHSHLGDGEQREMLPWLKIASELDPQKVETYTVASYWLRTQLNKPKEAEQFLRDGLRVNPDSHEILFELGRIYREHYNKPEQARNLWELALAKWEKQKVAGLEPNEFSYQQIFVFLATLERDLGNYSRAIQHWEALKKISPSKEAIAKRIEELKAASAAQ